MGTGWSLYFVCAQAVPRFLKLQSTLCFIVSTFLHSTDSYIEVLDGSRVHPETYEWARKMAVDALEYDESAEDANPAGALEEILENPERLKDLDLDAFAEELERQVCVCVCVCYDNVSCIVLWSTCAHQKPLTFKSLFLLFLFPC